ncbi:MAG TPA: MBL fold metallo-hydrolase [Acidimicrobiia bacterium]|nr:MBL fold metallo-hydrolase [Acidimicrobiia bacterium]
MCQGTRHDPAGAFVVPVDLGAYRGETIPLEPVERVRITTLVDNVCDLLVPDSGPARRRPLAGWPAQEVATAEDGRIPDGPKAEHGFSALVEVTRADGSEHRLLFDTGVSPDGMVENMRRMDIAPGDVEVVICSHGHFDHTMGLDGFARAVGRANVPVLIHPEFWSKRRIAIPGRDPWELPTTSRQALEGAGFDIVESERPSFLFDRSVLVTGEVARTTDFETGMAPHQARRNGTWEPDPLILDDQALIVHVRGRGLVVLTGCGHAGVVNITRYARHLTGVDAVHGVMGGFHLTGPSFDAIIPATVEALAELAPDVVVPAHCTGWKAAMALATRLPDALIQNTVGTTFDLAAA